MTLPPFHEIFRLQLKHSDFITKLHSARKVHEAYERLKDWQMVVKELDLTDVMRAGSVNAFYLRHKDDPIKPEWGHLKHKDVCCLKGWLDLSADETKAMLVRNIGIHEKLRPYWPENPPSQAMILLLLKSIPDWQKNVDYFEHGGRWCVHWKYAGELCKSEI